MIFKLPFFSRINREKTQLQTIVESLSEGVLVVNKDETVLLTNHALEKLFPEAAFWRGRQVLEGLTQVKLYDVIRKTLKDLEARSIEMILWRGKEELFVLVHVSPWLMEGRCQGVVMVFSDVTELRRLERHRREFVANVSHELKTPLTVIVGYAEMLREDESLPKSAREYIAKLEQNTKHLRNLVEDVLKISQSESGKFSLKPKNIEVLRMVQEIIRRFEPWLEERFIKVELAIPADHKVLADPSSLEQVISNLLSNAIRYNQQGGFIRVATTVEKQWLHLEVEDGGIGIPEDNLNRVFERFYRVDKARSRDVAGTGLGLAIVKHLMQLHGGKVAVKSKLGAGSTFTASFPRFEMN